MYLTKSEAVRLHRLLWNTIADETEKTKKKVTKRDALRLLGYKDNEILNYCFCCEYTEHPSLNYSLYLCDEFCPITWPTGDCLSKSIYQNWENTDNYKNAAELARQIANLPERPDADFDILE